MDDVVLIGDLKIVKKATVCFKDLFNKIGLQFNLLKCVLLPNFSVSTIVDGIEIQAKLYSIDAICHLILLIHDSDQPFKIESFLEPLLSNLTDEADRNSFGDSCGAVLVPGLDGSMIIIDVRSTDVSNNSNEKLAPSSNSPLRGAEETKIFKYSEKSKI
ncbi:hypothetical protein P9112_006776 [Eukaryota sp. TZLM1-RC]